LFCDFWFLVRVSIHKVFINNQKEEIENHEASSSQCPFLFIELVLFMSAEVVRAEEDCGSKKNECHV
jgi:hypothetical protein